jgi:7,8-dihydropterin-6-yl-methyl-4-(beta-D-ribofuranosyl)aminobenzene 5'-phosphate synthase
MEGDRHHTIEAAPLDDLTITIVHDNYPHAESLKTAWGFSAHVVGAGRSILFDTGSDGTLLLENLAALRIDPAVIDILVLSHPHGDHTGGLTGLLKAAPRLCVHLPESFPARIKDVIRGYGASIIEVRGPGEVCPNVYTTGVLGRRVREQAMVVRTGRGLIVLTGCAHPGIARIVTEVRRLHAEGILFVLGGFHLEWTMSRTVGKVIAVFENQGVRYVAPTHCSGEKARRQFEQHYGPRFIEVGVGRTIALADLA